MMSWIFWFSSFPPELAAWSLWLWVLTCVAFTGVGIALPRLVVQKQLRAFERAPWLRVRHLLLITAAVLWVLLFFRAEGIPGLSARWLLALVAVMDIAWASFIVGHVRTRVPAQRSSMEERQRKARYLP
ncbi:MAG: hypothetical protein Q7S96_00535 [bacterium]|nr:hypothetical protein [bacterium]